MIGKIVDLIQQVIASFAVALAIVIVISVGVLITTEEYIFGRLVSPIVMVPLAAIAFFFIRRYVVMNIIRKKS